MTVFTDSIWKKKEILEGMLQEKPEQRWSAAQALDALNGWMDRAGSLHPVEAAASTSSSDFEEVRLLDLGSCAQNAVPLLPPFWRPPL